jgi:hypothetical protein
MDAAMPHNSPAPFEASLDATTPPAGAAPPLRALWHGLRGDWRTAHQIVQAEDDRDSAWVHAWLHRIEGDLANAGYWYERAERPVASEDPRAEGLAIARAIDAKAGWKTPGSR